MQFRYKGRGEVKSGQYYWSGTGAVVDIPNDEVATVKKLLSHPSFELV